MCGHGGTPVLRVGSPVIFPTQSQAKRIPEFLVTPLTKSDIKDLVGLRQEDITKAVDAILAGKVCAKASKLLVPSLESLYSFCKRKKEDLIIKHEIMFKNGFMRPRKNLDYVPWTLKDWDEMARKTHINDAALRQFKQVILGTEAGRDWMKGRANQFCISSDDPPQEFEIAYLALWHLNATPSTKLRGMCNLGPQGPEVDFATRAVANSLGASGTSD